MRTIRRRNWFIKRIALGFAVAAFVAPVAQARVDQGSGVPIGQAKVDESLVVQAHTYQPAQANENNSMNKIELVRVEQPRSTGSDIVVAAYGTRPLPHDPALTRGDNGSAVNAHKPSSIGGALARGDAQASPSVVASILENQPSATSFDWRDAGIGSALALALVLLGGAVLATRRSNRVQTA